MLNQKNNRNYTIRKLLLTGEPNISLCTVPFEPTQWCHFKIFHDVKCSKMCYIVYLMIACIIFYCFGLGHTPREGGQWHTDRLTDTHTEIATNRLNR